MPRNPFNEHHKDQPQPEELNEFDPSNDIDRLKGAIDKFHDTEARLENKKEIKPEKPNFLGDISTAKWQPKERKDIRKRGPVLFVRNIDDLQEYLSKIAEKIGVPRDMLVRYLLEQGIQNHFSGDTQLIPVLDQRLTLYPGETPPRKRKKSNSKGVGFRMIPDHTNQQISQISDRLGVPKWQVIRRMLEDGVAGYKAGTITIQPHSVQTEVYTLYPNE
jgi:predicted DNA-binding protein